MDFQALQALLDSANIAILSPESSSRTDEENHKSFLLMEQLLKQAKIDFIPATGRSIQWGDERSFILKGISEEKARAIADLFNQEALIYKDQEDWQIMQPDGEIIDFFSTAEITDQADNMTVLDNGLAFSLR